MQQDITDITNEQWIKTFDTNIHSFFFLSKLIVPRMKRGDTVINCASINAYIGRPDLLDYTSTKGGEWFSNFDPAPLRFLTNLPLQLLCLSHAVSPINR